VRVAVRGLAGLRIAHVIESDSPGSVERTVAGLVTALQASGAFNVVFLPSDGEGWLGDQLAGTGIAIERFRFDGCVSPACARSLAFAFRRHHIDVAHSHEFAMAVCGTCASWIAGVGHIITMHGSRSYGAHWGRRFALRSAIALSDRTVAVSSRIRRQLSVDLRISPARIATVHNGVRYTQPEGPTLRDELGLQCGDRLLVSVGNLNPVNGHQYLIDAVALLVKRFPRLHLAISGRGDLADSLRLQARERGLTNRVHLLGLRSDVAAILAGSDVFVLPSLSEGVPVALLEAMSAGRAIVASDVGDVRSALADGEAGVLVKAGDPSALAAGIDRVLRVPRWARHLGERAAYQVFNHFDISHMVSGYADMYQELHYSNALPSGFVAVS